MPITTSTAVSVRPDEAHAQSDAPHASFARQLAEHTPSQRAAVDPLECDRTLRWLMASDRVVSDEVGKALLEVKQARLYLKEGHALWSAYLRAFVPLTSRWCQQEMSRERTLADYPILAEAYRSGSLCKSRLRAILRVVTPETEGLWCERGRAMTVREIEATAELEREARLPGDGAGGTSSAEAIEQEDDVARPRRRVFLAPPGVAALVAEAVEVARKLEGYQIGTGQAVALMAIETMAGMPASSNLTEQEAGDAAGHAEPDREGHRRAGDASLLGDAAELRRELFGQWQELHRQMESDSGRWSHLPWTLPEVFMQGPADDAGPHERVLFWTRIMAQLDALRGRFLRIVEERRHAERLHFACLGQYARERMGMTAREARDLIRLDRALSDLPAAFRMYAAGRMGRRASWAVTRVATPVTDRAWTRYALTVSLRLLEAAVEAALLKREADPKGWEESGGLPPAGRSFADTVRMCSHLEGVNPTTQPSARVQIVFNQEQEACFQQAGGMLRALCGGERPDWWCLAVMARHFLDCYAEIERQAVPAKLRRMLHRRVIERDHFTCAAPECLQRGRLEADHIRLRSLGGADAMENLVSLCVAHHRHLKHQVGSLALCGTAPDDLWVKMGTRVYRNDRLVRNAG